MSTTAQDTCRSVARLAEVLGALGDALARPDLGGLLEAQPLLDELTRTLAQASASAADRAALRPLLDEARLAMRRVELLGDSLLLATHASLAARGVGHGYGPGGHTVPAAPVTALDTRG